MGEPNTEREWNPSDVPGLQWFDASDRDSLRIRRGRVSRWWPSNRLPWWRRLRRAMRRG